MKKSFSPILSCLIVVFWYFNFSSWKILPLNFLFLALYFFLNGKVLGKILTRILNLEKEFGFIFGLFLLLYLIGLLMSLPIVFYLLPSWYLFLILFLLPVILFFFKKESQPKSLFENELKGKTSKIFYLALGMALLFCLALLFRARTSEYLRTPWQRIHPLYLEAWLFIIFLFTLLFLKKLSLKKFLIILILLSFVAHLYLIIPYEAGFGGDKWRHLGAEKWLAEGKIYSPALFGEKVSYKQIGPLKIPEVFVVGNKTSYANLWGLTIAFSFLTGLDFFYVDLFLTLILFSLFLPFLMLKLGSFFSSKKEFLYCFAFSPLLFSPFFIYAGLGAPLSFGFLPFLFALIPLFLFFQKEKSLKRLLLFFIFLLPFLYFNYVLYLSLFFAFFFLGYLVKKTAETKGGAKFFSIFSLLLVILFLSFFFVFLDSVEDYSWFDFTKTKKENLLPALKEFGNKTFTSAAIFPRVFEMEQDNWLYATTESDLSRSVLLKILPWHLIFTPIILIFAFIGILGIKKMKNPLIGLVLFLFLIILLFNQFIASSFMSGNHLFTKRMVLFIAFLFALFLSWGVYLLVNRLSLLLSKEIAVFMIALIFSLVSTTVYASGPKAQVVTGDELKSAYFLYEKIKDEKHPCVLANTWPLLALEMVSARKVVAGGFPVYYEYAQPERVFLFENMNKTPSLRYLERILEMTGSKKCYFATEERFIIFKDREKVIGGIKKILGEPQIIGQVLIWLYEPNK